MKGEPGLDFVVGMVFAFHVGVVGAAAERGDVNATLELRDWGPPQFSTLSISIRGVVTDPEGKPASKVQVSLFPSFFPHLEQVVETDGEGRFSLVYDPARFGPMRTGQPLVVARHPAHNLAAALELGEGDTNVRVRLSPGLVLVGRVTDPAGKAITNAEADVELRSGGQFSKLGSPVRADAKGRLEIKGLPLGREYGVGVSAEGYGRQVHTLEAFDAQTSPVELEPFELMPADQGVAGLVLDEDDQSVGEAVISAGGPHQPNTRARSDSEGHFSLEKVCDGPIIVFVQGPRGGDAEVWVGGGDTNVVIHLNNGWRGQQPTGRDGPFRMASPAALLKGKRLPDLAAMGLGEEAAPKGKPILLCLFDLEQRPSRHFVRQLAEQHDALRKKGVTVLGLQAAIISVEAFKEWENSSVLPFPVGRVVEPGDKVKWAAKAPTLP